MQFRSELNRPEPHRYAQKNFRKYLDVYEDVINEKTGKLETIITDKTPVDEKIQEAKDSVSLESLLDRYKIDLSKEVIKEISDDIIDMTIMPQDPVEAFAIMNEARKNFEDTTSDFKKEFNSDFGEYLAGFKNGKTQEIINKHNKHLVEKIQEANNKTETMQPVQQINQQQPVQQINQQQPVQQTTQNTVVGGQTYNV